MKIQCACGAKYAFDVSPEQARQPVQFICPTCGLDSSDYVTNLIRQQFGITSNAPAVAPAPEIALPPPGVTSVPTPVSATAPAPPPPPPTPVAAPRMRLNMPGAKAAETPAEEEVTERMCSKHAKVTATDECRVCHKPICPQCMALFGYVCSPHCRQKAELQGLRIPVFAGQKSVMQARMWRKLGWTAGSVAALIVGFIGFKIWYGLFGSAPRVAFSVRFEERATSGASFLCGPDNSQVVFLHGGTLARHDTKTKKEIWSVNLIDQKEIQKEVAAEIKSRQELQLRLNHTSPDAPPVRIPSPERLAEEFARSAAEALELRVVGQNIWVAAPEQVVRHDWDTGQPADKMPVEGGFGGLIERGEELLRLDRRPGRDVITHINLATGKIQDEEIVRPVTPAASNAPPTTLAGAARAGRRPGGAGLPTGTPGRDANRPLDARKVERQTAQLPLPARIALPAVLSTSRGQERLQAELDSDQPQFADEEDDVSGEYYSLIPARDGHVYFSSRLIEKRMVAQQAMKAPPGKSALDGPVSVTASLEVANEIFNDMQRDRGGETVLVDESRYQVTLRAADGKAGGEWTGEVIGPPSVFPLNTVNVVAAHKKILVFDKRQQKLWEAPLSYNVEAEPREGDPATTGQGPCVERGNTLFVFDEGVLTAFDLKTGNAQWRLPSVGISGLFFDEAGMLYVSSTTASPDQIKFSRQIDVSTPTLNMILKLDPSTGKTLWTHETGGQIAYLGGKYLYTFQSSGFDPDQEEGSGMGIQFTAMLRIRRVDLKNGRALWEHSQPRAPIDVRFDLNRLHLVFRKEVQVLKCGTL